MELAIIIWLYLVGLGVTYSLMDNIKQHWSRTAIVIGWPITLPFAVIADKIGWLDRARNWAILKMKQRTR